MNAEPCGALLASVSRSFYLSIRALPEAIRQPVALAYLLARASDTIADTETAPASLRMEGLRVFRELIRNGTAVALPAEIRPEHAGERRLLAELPACLESVAHLAEADRADVVSVLETITTGQELDVRRFGNPERTESLQTAAELEEYTYLVAGCVGEFWTRVCARHVPRYAALADGEMERLGRNFGKGLQLVNILRDLPADLRAGRAYLPREETEDDPNRMRASFARWMEQAELHLADGLTYIENVRPWRLRYACFLPWRIGVLTLRLMKAHPPLDTPHRVKVSRGAVRRSMLSGLLAALSNRALRCFATQRSGGMGDSPVPPGQPARRNERPRG